MIDIKVSGVSRGQKVTLVVYNGESIIEGEAIACYLQVYYKNKTPLPLNDGFSLRINDIVTIENPPDRILDKTARYSFQVRIIGVIETETVAFCMRCFANSAVPLNNANFCHNCGGEGTCIEMDKDNAKYLRGNIESAIEDVRKGSK